MTAPQMGRIFISYRRDDSAGYAGRIYDRLEARFGKNAIFMDVDTIDAGLDFVEVLENAVQSCDVLVALIGKQWLNIKDKAGKRRLDNPQDFVRIEVAAALKRGIRVIPVLIDGIPMPNSDQLPSNLESLARRNAVLVYHHSFHDDANRLIEQLERALEDREPRAKEEDERLASEKAVKEKAEREVAEKAARQKVEREATENARREKEERESAEKIVDHRNIGPRDFAKIEWISIPAGTYFYGTVEEKKADAFQIGKYPVTNEQFSTFVQATGYQTQAEEKGSSYVFQGEDLHEVEGANWRHPLGPESNLDKKEKHPVVHVSWFDANAFCKWANCRLLNEAEWERSARGDNDYTYPWGNEWDSQRCNSVEAKFGSTSPVTQFSPAGDSPFGCADMSGNVWEWMENWYDESETRRVLRGGSWGNPQSSMIVSKRFYCYPELSDNRIGFRCAISINR